METLIDEAIDRYKNNAEYERTHGNLQGCLEFRQLVEWLKDYKRLKEQEPKPMVEIDLYSVIKQKYVEREVFDKIRADVINIADSRRSIPVRSVINIIDKFKVETGDKE